MPDRIVRGSILKSKKVNSLTWAAEVFYRRLHSVVDDFGCFDASAAVIRTSLYPKQLDKVSEQDVAKWMRNIAEAGLVRLYEHDEDMYLEVLDFNQRLRQKKRKYPAPPDCCQPAVSPLSSGGPSAEPESESEVESDNEENTGPPAEKNALTGLKTETQNTPPVAPPPHGLENSNLFRKPVIPLFDDVHRIFIQQGGTKEMAEKFFQKHEATGWYISNSPVQNVGALISLYISNWRGNEKQNGITKNQSKSERNHDAQNELLAGILARNPGISS